jgi:hypothetical protein
MDATVDTVPLGLLYPSLLYVAPGKGSSWLDYFIGQAATEMALRTRVLRYTYTQDSQAGVRDYPIEVPEGYELAYVERVCINGQPYTPSRDTPCRPPENMGTCGPMPGCGTNGAKTPFTYNVIDDNQLVSVDLPQMVDMEDGVEIEVSFAPKRNSCLLPKLLYDRYASAIISLALNEILLDPTLKTPARTLNLINRRADALVRRAKQDGESAASAGVGTIGSNTGEFLI